MNAGIRHRRAEVTAKQCPRLATLPAVLEQQVLDQRTHRRLDGHLALEEHTTLRRRHVLGHLLRHLLVPERLRRERQPQQLRAIQEPDRQNLAGPTPGPRGLRRPLRAELPEPPHVPRMQLHGRSVVLPLAQRPHDVAEPVGLRPAHLDRHPLITHHPTDPPHPVFPPEVGVGVAVITHALCR
ncbi:hypothetical protein ACFQGX_09525 [Nonomuraea dietziae]|uniref:hypothetical protein n=1 Tax=Nonomuraea dietziae TaxID=65515 RepID=UPI0036172D3F